MFSFLKKIQKKMTYKELKMFIKIRVRTLNFIPHLFHHHL